MHFGKVTGNQLIIKRIVATWCPNINKIKKGLNLTCFGSHITEISLVIPDNLYIVYEIFTL